jgi:integrase
MEPYRESGSQSDRIFVRHRCTVRVKWISTLRQRGGHNGKPLSAKTCRHAFVLLSTAWRWAIRMQFAATNPLAAVVAPSVPRSKARALAVDEISRVLAAASQTRWGTFVAFAFATGMQRGEMCALEWRDVDLERGTANVERSLCETRDGAALQGTKTGRGRTVLLSRHGNRRAAASAGATGRGDLLTAAPRRPPHGRDASTRRRRRRTQRFGDPWPRQRDAIEKLGDRLELIADGNRMATAEGLGARKRP